MSNKTMGKNSSYNLTIESEIEGTVEIVVSQEIGLQFRKTKEIFDLCLDNNEIREIKDLLVLFLKNSS